MFATSKKKDIYVSYKLIVIVLFWHFVSGTNMCNVLFYAKMIPTPPNITKGNNVMYFKGEKKSFFPPKHNRAFSHYKYNYCM